MNMRNLATIRNGKAAVEFAEHACKAVDYKEPLFIGTLAAAYAEAGRYAEAVDAAGRARDLANQLNRKDVANRNAELLELYRSGKAYHDSPGP